jgi:hypothetical protein
MTMKINLTGALALFMAFSLLTVSCKEKSQQAPPQTQNMQPQTASPHGMVPPAERTVSLPDSVKGKWSAVKVEVLYKEKNEKKQFDVPLNSDFAVPDSDIVISVGEFFPEFTLDGNTYTSISNEEKNPATKVKITQEDKVIFEGWLFTNFPSVHPFENEKYGITLVGGIAAK